jgi:Flp pilus assembly protein TadD
MDTAGSDEAALVRQVAGAVGASQIAVAAEVSDAAIRRGFVHPTFYYARGLGAQEQGRQQDALNDFETALPKLPPNAIILNAIALCLARLNRLDEAIARFDQALKLAPNSPLTHFRKGWALVNAGQMAAATQEYERAIALQPDFAEALAGLASIAARHGDAQNARDLAGRALAVDPQEPTALVALSMTDIAARDFKTAEERLRPLTRNPAVTGHPRAVALGFLADALDGQQQYSEAFAHYVAENEEFRRLHAARYAGGGRASDKIRQWLDYIQSADPAPWKAVIPQKKHGRAPREHVFLMGFLRSGTTLLEQVLATHPDIVHLEERDTFQDSARSYLTDAPGLERLAHIAEYELENARDSYWNSVHRFGVEPAGQVFVDKQPLNAFNLPLIAKMFPSAKIVFAIRDPRDVVFSCFRRHFEINPTMFEFLTLSDGARFYALVMELAQAYRTVLPLDILDHRYEDMIADFDGRIQRVCQFLGLEWTEAMRDFGAKAQEREIRSPSALQVRRGLYGDGAGQWRHYEKELAPIEPILAPWVQNFGYESR